MISVLADAGTKQSTANGGDSFAAGIIYALSHYDDEQYAINFAVAASCLKHTINGDFNLSRLSEVEALCKGDGSGRVQR